MMVSVIIPSFNRCNLIGFTVDSVLAQTYTDLEVIVVDDGSTDRTREYLASRYSGEPRVRYIWQVNSERSVARNHGIKLARGEFIAFLDSDDLWQSDKLEKQLKHFAAEPNLVMVHTDWCQLYDDGTRQRIGMADLDCVRGNIYGNLVYRNLVGSATPLVRREVFKRLGGFNEDRRLLCFEDWEMWTRIAAHGPVGYLAEVYAIRRVHGGNTETKLTPEVYRRFVSAVMRDGDSSQRAVWSSSARRRFWHEIKVAVHRRDLQVARSYFWNELICLGIRNTAADVMSQRWLVANLLFGCRGASVLFSLWRTSRTHR